MLPAAPLASARERHCACDQVGVELGVVRVRDVLRTVWKPVRGCDHPGCAGGFGDADDRADIAGTLDVDGDDDER